MWIRGRRGQSAVELALIAPVLVGFFSLALQGGLIVSDQVSIEHYATEAAQWAVSHPDAATPDGGSAGTITQHIYQQMCDGSSLPPSASGARFCNGPPASAATVTVSERVTPVSEGSLGPMRMLAASSCATKRWSLAVSPTTATADLSGTGTAHFAVTLSTSGPGTNPQVSLHTAQKPAAFLTPYFSPADVSVTSTTSALDIPAQQSSPNGPGKVKLYGRDECGLVRSFTVTVIVANSTATALTACPSAAPAIAGVDLTVISNAAATVVTITGVNFQNGATVAINNTAATLVTVVSSTQIVATIPAGLPTGVYNLTVTNPNSCVASAYSAVSVVTNSNSGNFGGVCTGTGCPGSGGNNGGTGFGGGPQVGARAPSRGLGRPPRLPGRTPARRPPPTTRCSSPSPGVSR